MSSTITSVTVTEFEFTVDNIGLEQAAAGVGNMAYVKGGKFPARRFAVRISTSDGATGEYVAHWVGTPASFAQVCMLSPLLVGRDADQREKTYDDLKRELRAYDHMGHGVLDNALWDLAGKSLGVPTYRLLGGATRQKVLVYRHVGGKTPADLIEHAQKLLDEGWRVLRISPIDTLTDGFNSKLAVLRGIEHFSALREAVGDEVEIIFEVHTRLTPTRAIELCKAIEDLRPFFVEDPIRSENPGSFAILRSQTSVPIGTGEQLHHKWAYRELIEQELIDYLRVDICHTGGITEGKKLAAMAEVHYQELACHYTSSPVSTAAMLHLNMSIPNCAVQEYAPATGWMNDVIQHNLQTEDGYLLSVDTPGLGIDLNEEAALAHPHTPGVPPHLRREDGSVQDW